MPELGLTLLSGRRHLNREIRWVVLTDLHDPRRYLCGGELVLTGLMWRRDGDSDSYVRNLTAAGVTALGVGDHPDCHAVPDDLLAACEAHGLPLFAVDPDIAFAEITERIVQRLSAGRSGDLASLLERHRRLIATDGLGQILELLRSELGMECLVLSPTGRPIRGGLPLTDPDRAAIVRRVRTATALPQRVTLARYRCVSVFGIGSTIHTGRFLVVEDDHTRWPPERRLVAEQLAALLMLELDDPAVRPVGDTELVAAVTGGGADADDLQRAGLPADGPMTVIVATGTPEPLREVVLAETLAGSRAESIATATAWATRGPETIAIIAGEPAAPAARTNLLAWARHCATTLAAGNTAGAVSIGVADPVRTAGSLRGALEQARHTAALARPRPGGIDVAEPDHLVSHRMLLAAIPADVRSAFRTRVLDPLIEYDARHRSDLLVTLRRFLESDGSWRHCADTLHLHVNTVRYRMRRVEQLTGRDLRNPLDRMDLALAVSIEGEAR
jgi:hypothetical protein